jgi:carbon monoxide dehydrogenase subunit G
VEIEQSFQVPFAPEQVWRCFHDTEGIVACLPGASLSAPPEQGKLKLTMSVKLGPIVAAFAGDGEILLDDATRQGRVTGGGSDRKSGSRVKGEAAFSVHDAGAAGQPPAARVDVRVDYAIAGSLAQFSRGGVVQALAARMTEAFADNLKRKLEAESAPAEPAQPASVKVQGAVRSAPPAAPVDLGNFFWPLLLKRLRRLFGLRAGQ